MSDGVTKTFAGKVVEWIPESDALSDCDTSTLRDEKDYETLETFPIKFLEDTLRSFKDKKVVVQIVIAESAEPRAPPASDSE